MSYKNFLLLFIGISLFIDLSAQDKPPVKFGSVKPEDFDISKFLVDTSNGAIVIADIGNSSFEGNNKGSFSLIFKRQCRIKILNKKGFGLANIEIPLYISSKGDAEEKLEKLKATTYNLENGKLVESGLNKDAVFKDKLDKNHLVKKFSMPSIKEGSIIEYSYTIISDFLFNLQPWYFQGME